MDKVISSQDQQGNHVAWLMRCPGCDQIHVFDARWEFNGDLGKPTFSPSHLIIEGPNIKRCHLFVRNGQIEFCQDSQHVLAGKTVSMLDASEI